jgi:hypothetical protein
MELKGYQVKLNALEKQFKQFDFYKHGKLQGHIPSENIILHKSPLRGVGGLGAIIRYYKDKFSVKQLIDENKKPYPQQKYATALTEHLKKTFGWEFVFFKSGNHDKPYGYVIIDHKNRQVYKGNEVMKLHELLNIDKTGEVSIKPSTTENKSVLQLESLFPTTVPGVPNVPVVANVPTATTDQDDYQQSVSTEILNEIGNQEMYEADSLAKKNFKPAKGKKKINY